MADSLWQCSQQTVVLDIVKCVPLQVHGAWDLYKRLSGGLIRVRMLT